MHSWHTWQQQRQKQTASGSSSSTMISTLQLHARQMHGSSRIRACLLLLLAAAAA
jgi:hypothetical protein